MAAFLASHTVRDLVGKKAGVIQVPYTSTVGDVVIAMEADDMLAFPVVAPPFEHKACKDRLVEIMQVDSRGKDSKQFIGVASVLDILIHLTNKQPEEMEEALEAPIWSILGQSKDGLGLTTIPADATLQQALERMTEGTHRFLVPMDTLSKEPESTTPHPVCSPRSPEPGSPSSVISLKEPHLIEILKSFGSPRFSARSRGGTPEGSPSAKGKSEVPRVRVSARTFQYLSLADLGSFLFRNIRHLGPFVNRNVKELGAVQCDIPAISAKVMAIDALRCMREAGVSTVAVVQEIDGAVDTKAELVSGIGRQLVGSLSASDLRGIPAKTLRALSGMTIQDFLSGGSGMAGFSTVFSPRMAARSGSTINSLAAAAALSRSTSLKEEVSARPSTDVAGFGTVFTPKWGETEDGEEFGSPPLSPVEKGLTPSWTMQADRAKNGSGRHLPTCTNGWSFKEVLEEVLSNRIHVVWVVDKDGLLGGAVGLIDILQVVARELTKLTQ